MEENYNDNETSEKEAFINSLIKHPFLTTKQKQTFKIFLNGSPNIDWVQIIPYAQNDEIYEQFMLLFQNIMFLKAEIIEEDSKNSPEQLLEKTMTIFQLHIDRITGNLLEKEEEGLRIALKINSKALFARKNAKIKQLFAHVRKSN